MKAAKRVGAMIQEKGKEKDFTDDCQNHWV